MKLQSKILALALLSSTAMAAQGPQSFTYQGRAFNQAGTLPITSSIDLTLTILAPNNCILYEESQSGIDLSASDGKFSVQVGSAIGSMLRTANDAGLSMSQIFSNNPSVPTRAAGANCSSGYTPAANDVRKLQVQIGVAGAAKVMVTPNMTISAVPFSVSAENLQGKAPTDFVNVEGNVSQVNMDTLTGAGDASALHNHDSIYVRKDAQPTFSQASVTTVGTSGTAAVNKQYVDTAVSGVQSQVTTVAGNVTSDETSISSLQSSVAGKANTTDLTNGLALKENITDANSALALKANTTDLTNGLALKENITDANSALALKANTTDLTNGLALKENITDANSALALKADASSLSNYLTTSAAGTTYLPSTTAATTYATITSDSAKMPTAGGTFSGPVASTSQISYKSYNATSNSIDWNNGQMQYITVSAVGTFTFSHMIDGGSYTLAVTSSVSGTNAFATDSSEGTALADASFHALPDKTVTASHTSVYNFLRLGSTVYMTNTGPF
jgi:hypothetical protein